MKTLKQAPLPFQGQKRNFVKHFIKALKNYPADATYVDLFGGSGLLSYTVKSVYPDAKVVYNDFDNYRQRIENIPNTNAILDELRALNIATPRGKRIVGDDRRKVLEVLKRHNEKGYVDWISLSSSLKFSMNYGVKLEDFTNDTLYNNIRKSNYNLAEDYLRGIQIVNVDYKELYNQYKSESNVVFLVDPPYLSTDVSTYNSGAYWTLSDYLDVVDVLNGKFFYFTSNKSHIVELMKWIENRTPTASPFTNAVCTKINTSVNCSGKYTDIMYYKV